LQTGLAVQALFHGSVFLFQSSAVFFFPEDQDEGKLNFIFNKHDVKMVECFCMFIDQDAVKLQKTKAAKKSNALIQSIEFLKRPKLEMV